jgi:hypothetical protein
MKTQNQVRKLTLTALAGLIFWVPASGWAFREGANTPEHMFPSPARLEEVPAPNTDMKSENDSVTPENDGKSEGKSGAVSSDELEYAAQFENMRLEIRGEQVRISSKDTGETQALCKIERIERKISDRKPVSLDFDCQGAKLSSFRSLGSITWQTEGNGKGGTVKLGSWVNGYKTASLKVDLDRI